MSSTKQRTPTKISKLSSIYLLTAVLTVFLLLLLTPACVCSAAAASAAMTAAPCSPESCKIPHTAKQPHTGAVVSFVPC